MALTAKSLLAVSGIGAPAASVAQKARIIEAVMKLSCILMKPGLLSECMWF